MGLCRCVSHYNHKRYCPSIVPLSSYPYSRTILSGAKWKLYIEHHHNTTLVNIKEHVLSVPFFLFTKKRIPKRSVENRNQLGIQNIKWSKKQMWTCEKKAFSKPFRYSPFQNVKNKSHLSYKAIMGFHLSHYKTHQAKAKKLCKPLSRIIDNIWKVKGENIY